MPEKMEMESMKKGGEEQEKESTKEEKVKEVHTIQGDTNNTTLSQNPADNKHTIMPTACPPSTHTLALPKHPTASSIVDVVRTMARMATNEGVRVVSNDMTCLAPPFFNWAEDVDETVTPVASTARVRCDFLQVSYYITH